MVSKITEDQLAMQLIIARAAFVELHKSKLKYIGRMHGIELHARFHD